MVEEFDVLVKDATIVDGSGSPSFKGDIGIKDGKIVKVGKIKERGEIEINAKNLIATPGFIDPHSHADETILFYPEANNYVMQGVTTVVGGNCGFSPAPLKDKWLLSFWEFEFWDEIVQYKYYEPLIAPLDTFRKLIKSKLGVDIDWKTFGEFLKKVEETGISINYVPLVGHNTIRAQVMGEDHERDPTLQELEEMKELVREAMEAGAFGLSTGLDYPPGAYAKTEEIIELVKVVKEYNGIYATHWRRTGVRRGTRTRPFEKIKGIEEAIKISKETGVPVEISHLLSGYVIYPEPIPPELIKANAGATLKVIDKAIENGVDVGFDVIPNTDGGVIIIPYLISLLSPWLRESGSIEQFLKNLKAEDYRTEIKEVIQSGKWYWINPKINPYWARKIKIIQSKEEKYVGKTLEDIAREENKDPMDVIFEIISRDPETRIETTEIAHELEITTFLKHPKAMPCSDVFALDEKWEVRKPPYYLPHPNTYGIFPRYLRRYVKEEKVLTLEEAIRKLTSLPAQRFKLKNKGVIKEGADADIVLFDFKRIKDVGDYLEPRKYPEGIEYVIVNGKIVVENGKHTQIKPGKVIRHNHE